jgi:hypothetical protein
MEIPVGITELGDNLFADCTSFTNIALPEGLTRIGDTAFANSSLTTITLSSTIKTIGVAAFVRNRTLTTVNIPESVQQITFEILGGSAFAAFEGSSNINLVSQAALRRVGYKGPFSDR